MQTKFSRKAYPIKYDFNMFCVLLCLFLYFPRNISEHPFNLNTYMFYVCLFLIFEPRVGYIICFFLLFLLARFLPSTVLPRRNSVSKLLQDAEL